MRVGFPPLGPTRPLEDVVEVSTLVGGEALKHLRQGRIALPPHSLGNVGVTFRRLLLHGRRDGEQFFERLD